MKQNKNIIYSSMLLIGLLFFMSCDKNHSTKPGNAAYMEEAANNKPIVSLTIDVNGGSTYVQPRLANLANKQTNLVVGLDKEALDLFNKKNNSEYIPLEQEDFELIYSSANLKGQGSISIPVEKNDIGLPLEIKVKNLDNTKYPPAKKVAIPLSIISSDMKILDNVKSVIITINRPLVTSVSKMTSGGFTVEFAEDLKEKTIDGWTFQFTGNFKNLNRGNLNVGYFGGQEGGFYTRINERTGIQVKNGRDGDDTWTQKPLEAKKWLQITYVYKDQTVSVYVNGVLQKTFGTTKIFHKEGSSFSIGNGGYDDYLREVRFWSKPLTETEILENLYLPLDPNTDALESYLPLTKEAGVTDLTPHNNKVTIHSGAIIKWIENVKFPSDELVIIE